VEPGFKILLFPFNEGDSIPLTTWNATKDTLQIDVADHQHTIHFQTEAAGNIRMECYKEDPTSNLIQNTRDIFLLYPNPSKDLLHLLWPQGMPSKGLLSIIDMQGIIRLKCQIADQIDVSTLAPGRYRLQWHDDKNMMEAGFVKQ